MVNNVRFADTIDRLHMTIDTPGLPLDGFMNKNFDFRVLWRDGVCTVQTPVYVSLLPRKLMPMAAIAHLVPGGRSSIEETERVTFFETFGTMKSIDLVSLILRPFPALPGPGEGGVASV